MILLILIIIIIIICGKFIYDQHKFNDSTKIIQLQDSNKTTINNYTKEKSPIVIHNLLNKHIDLENFSLEKINQNNPGYIIKDNNKNIVFSSLLDDNNMSINNNEQIIKDINLENHFQSLINTFTDHFSYNITNKMNILKGPYSINLSQNKNNIKLISQLVGESILYIFNPKYKEEIINKENFEIKKWGAKIILKTGILLYIPSDWFYIIESEDKSIFVTSTIDTYFTFIYNSLR